MWENMFSEHQIKGRIEVSAAGSQSKGSQDCFCSQTLVSIRRHIRTVSFHNFKSQNFKLSVSNPKNKYVAYVSVLSQISNCGLGCKNKHEILKTDRTSAYLKCVIICVHRHWYLHAGCIYIYIYSVALSLSLSVHVYIYIYIHIHKHSVCVYIYIYIHTY